MNLKLQGKTAFITGSTSGIGWATARTLAQEVVHMILNGRGAVELATVIAKEHKTKAAAFKAFFNDFRKSSFITAVC
jgi:NAD(P)-dependent dehydrogenase (short-subunit alcohol dehydrogenase family)